jgi:L-iditol 2-dehydrogenase
MKAILVHEIGSFVMSDVDVPKPATGNVLLHVNVAGLCRTDLKIIRAGHKDLVLPPYRAKRLWGRYANWVMV